MKPGRELDTLIAAKVMGFKSITKNNYGVQFFGSDNIPGKYREIPLFSTDIAAAWEVVEKIKQRFKYRLHLYDCHEDGTIEAQFFEDGLAEAKTVPHAIALAALKAIGLNEAE